LIQLPKQAKQNRVSPLVIPPKKQDTSRGKRRKLRRPGQGLRFRVGTYSNQHNTGEVCTHANLPAFIVGANS
jgi:hypothetical protein